MKLQEILKLNFKWNGYFLFLKAKMKNSNDDFKINKHLKNLAGRLFLENFSESELYATKTNKNCEIDKLDRVRCSYWIHQTTFAR
jgi:hypothetical protein